jgi:hypothetical protein
MSRSWHLSKDDWIKEKDSSEDAGNRIRILNNSYYKIIAVPFPFGDKSQEEREEVASKEKEGETMGVVADESQSSCRICGEKFEVTFDAEQDEWIYKNTIMVDDIIYHKQCYDELLSRGQSSSSSSSTIKSPKNTNLEKSDESGSKDNKASNSPTTTGIIISQQKEGQQGVTLVDAVNERPTKDDKDPIISINKEKLEDMPALEDHDNVNPTLSSNKSNDVLIETFKKTVSFYHQILLHALHFFNDFIRFYHSFISSKKRTSSFVVFVIKRKK